MGPRSSIMRILSITAGAAGMYCGSCLRDNALAAELKARGHDVTLLPMYTPTLTDEPNVSGPRVVFGGISIYLQQKVPIFRKLPRFVDRLLDSPAVIRLFAERASSTDPRLLGDLTISMLEGVDGVLRKEFEKLLEWLADDPAPDVVNLPNSMLIALARPLARRLKRPICCTLQGEDLFLDGLDERYRERALALIRRQVADVDRFIAVSDFCAASMSSRLRIPREQIRVVPLGVNLKALEAPQPGAQGHAKGPAGAPRDVHTPGSGGIFRVGYMARIAPEKGLLVLAEGYQRFRRQVPDAKARLDAAGYLGPDYRPYLAEVERSMGQAGLAGEFTYHGAVDWEHKVAFLRQLDVLSMPATYDEPKGLPLLEAMACGIPLVQPRRGAFIEILDRTGGGLLVEPDDPDALAAGLGRLYRDVELRSTLGRRGIEGVRASYTVQRSAERLLEVYGEVVSGSRTPETVELTP
jgi:glycosyltransferase involved in cell wall biosynthesis